MKAFIHSSFLYLHNVVIYYNVFHSLSSVFVVIETFITQIVHIKIIKIYGT